MSPALIPNYELAGKHVVIIDVLRATSSICVAFETGVDKILPVSTPEECMLFKDFDFLCAAERNAIKLPGFDMGNSPFEFKHPLLKGKSIAFTTTNGTKAIKMSRSAGAAQIIIGSLLNVDAVVSYLISQHNDIVLVCSGWKDKVNLEDTLCAGAIASALNDHVETNCDATLMAMHLFKGMETNLEFYIRQSSHALRFKALHQAEDDVAFCSKLNTVNVLPVMQGEYIRNIQLNKPA